VSVGHRVDRRLYVGAKGVGIIEYISNIEWLSVKVE